MPYPVESALSGIMRHETNMWYRRTFTVPKNWQIGKGQRLQLHFQAVDYDATVIVNGKTVTQHTGGYDAFSVDVTDALTTAKTQELVVGVADPNDRAASRSASSASPATASSTRRRPASGRPCGWSRWRRRTSTGSTSRPTPRAGRSR